MATRGNNQSGYGGAGGPGGNNASNAGGGHGGPSGGPAMGPSSGPGGYTSNPSGSPTASGPTNQAQQRSQQQAQQQAQSATNMQGSPSAPSTQGGYGTTYGSVGSVPGELADSGALAEQNYPNGFVQTGEIEGPYGITLPTGYYLDGYQNPASVSGPNVGPNGEHHGPSQQQDTKDTNQNPLPEGESTPKTGSGKVPEAVWNADHTRILAWKDPDTGDIIQDYAELWAMQDNISEMSQNMGQTIGDWAEQNGIFFEDINDPLLQMAYIADMQAQGLTPQLLGQASEYQAQQLGYANAAEMNAAMQGMTQGLSGGVSGMEGMPEEERLAREELNRQRVREAEDRAQRMLNAIFSDTGSRSRYLAQADQAMREINNVALENDIALANDIWARKQAEFQAQSDYYMNMVQQGIMSQSQFLEANQELQSNAIQAYAQQVSASLEQNQQYLQMYQADQQATTAAIQSMYANMMSYMGITTAQIEQANSIWEMSVAPQMLEMQQQAINSQTQAQQSASAANWFAAALGGLGTILNAFSWVPA